MVRGGGGDVPWVRQHHQQGITLNLELMYGVREQAAGGLSIWRPSW